MDVRKTQNDALEPKDIENNNPTAIFHSENVKLLSDKLSFALNCIKNGTLNLNTSDESSKLSLKIINGKINLDVSIATSCCKSCEISKNVAQNKQNNKKNEIKSDTFKESKKNNINLCTQNNKKTIETVQQQKFQNSNGWSEEIITIEEEEENDKSTKNNNIIKSKSTVHKNNDNQANLSTKNIKLCEQSTAGCSKNLDHNLSQKETINKNCKSASNLNKSTNFSTKVFLRNQSNQRKRKLLMKEILDSDDISSTESSEENETDNSSSVTSLSRNQICKIEKCPLESKEHEKHGVIRQFVYSEFEEKCMLRYLINNDCISRAKGLVVWTEMIESGFMKHRTAQSLLNNFRRQILPNLKKFNLSSTIRDKLEDLIP